MENIPYAGFPIPIRGILWHDNSPISIANMGSLTSKTPDRSKKVSFMNCY